MNPDDLLEQLYRTANSRKKKSLAILNEICREQYERGSRDFSVATIARISEARGGPVKGTIHNKTGDDFKGLIRAWAAHSGGQTGRARRAIEGPYETLIRQIPDPSLRAMVGGILSENRKLRREIDLLKAHSDRVLDLRETRDVAIDERGIRALPSLLQPERAALRHAISERLFRDQGWTASSNGEVTNEAGRQIYKCGYVTAIQRIVDVEEGR